MDASDSASPIPWPYPDHRAWLKREPLGTPVGGFSLWVRDGLVAMLVTLSALNPLPDFRLPIGLATELEALLPCGPDYKRSDD